MCLLAAKACGSTDLEQHRKLAAIIEMLHTATLVHDDVVDESGLRRGRPTANATWNNQTAVLVGDFLISRAFDLLVDLNDMVLLKDFSTGTCEIAEGEVLQLQSQHDPETTEQTYLNIIHGKTSRLFELATEVLQFFLVHQNIVNLYDILLDILVMHSKLLMIFWTIPPMQKH